MRCVFPFGHLLLRVYAADFLHIWQNVMNKELIHTIEWAREIAHRKRHTANFYIFGKFIEPFIWRCMSVCVRLCARTRSFSYVCVVSMYACFRLNLFGGCCCFCCFCFCCWLDFDCSLDRRIHLCAWISNSIHAKWVNDDTEHFRWNRIFRKHTAQHFLPLEYVVHFGSLIHTVHRLCSDRFRDGLCFVFVLLFSPLALVIIVHYVFFTSGLDLYSCAFASCVLILCVFLSFSQSHSI